MLRSKVFIKAMLIVFTTISIFAFVLSIIIVPKVENTIKSIEEENAKHILHDVVEKINGFHKDLANFRETSIEQHKRELMNLTGTVLSIIQTKYNQSKIKNIGQVLEKRSLEFEKYLVDFYNKNKDEMSKDELKNNIKKFIDIYRYEQGNGYFWAHEYESSRMVIHPISSELNDKKTDSVFDIGGVNIYDEIKKSLRDKKSAIVKYKWLNPISNNIEKKISYVFKFEPYNWVIGTGEYYEVLKKRLQDETFELIKQIRYDRNNYFFVMNYDNFIVAHPYVKGMDFSKIKDIKGNLFVPQMVKIAKEKGEGFLTYWWRKNEIDKNPYKKLSYVKDFSDWQMVIGTGIHVDLIEKEVEKRKKELMSDLRELIEHTRLVKTGYLYILDKSGTMVIHPNSDWVGKDFSKLIKNPVTNKYMYDEIKEAYKSEDKQFYYILNRPSDKENFIYEKLAWIDYVPELGWYVASSLYTDELKESAIEVRNYIIAISLIVLTILLIISFIFFKNLLNPLNKLSNLVQKVSKGDFSTRFPIENRSDEISILAQKFNEMVETIESRTKDLEDSNGELEYMIENLKKTQDKLIESEKMASLGELVAGVAHEINTPVGIGLTAASHIAYISEVVKDSYKNEKMTQKEFEEYISEADKLANIIFSNLTKTSDIVKNFKQVAIDQPSEQKRIYNVKEYTTGILFSIENIMKHKDIKVDIICDDNININFYPGQYSQIITNLIINSVKHGFKSKDKGSILIDISLVEESLNLIYKDDGEGIPEENLSEIYNPFFTTNKEGGGSGLGLNIIYNLITNNFKGSIKCESKLGSGVTFKINIPINAEDIKSY